ncbi:hypothetical protein AB2B41_12310 [Marimonas sp. MJW-29]|uniref:NAD(P)/FAD-dependent oxidoreductase n=1 Tax=Sulfitobacter sediminis TaxID=3234186 RepID=A0ABV3RN51_9RHOB
MQTDYLISGAGATALSFLDVLLTQTDASAVIVDRRDAPGGHWNDAYPFVRLHQSASFYGVASRPLGKPREEGQDILAPTYELSTKSEILHYFHDLMENTYLPTGRVTYLRNSEHLGDGRIRHLITGEETQITAGKIVNAGNWGDMGSIPATHTPTFDIAPGVTCVPINDMPSRAKDHPHFCVIGAGKTGMDAAVWLLEQGVAPKRITWVRPNDYWLFNREAILNHPARFTTTVGSFLKELEALGSVSNVAEFCAEMEELGVWHRIDPTVTPTKFHAAVCSPREVALLAQITNVIRMGHITALTPGHMQLADGIAEMPPGTLYIDCTASAGVRAGPDAPPVFDGNQINFSMIRPFQPLFSAALIAFLEARVPDAAVRAACTNLVDFHDTPRQYIAEMLPAIMNQGAWSKVPLVKDWIDRTRLQAMTHLMVGFDPSDSEKMELMGKFGAASKAAVQNIPKILANP